MVNSTASSELQVELLPRLSRNLRIVARKDSRRLALDFQTLRPIIYFSAASAEPSACVWEVFGTISDSVRLRTCLVYCRTFGRTPKSASTAVAELGTSAGYQRVRRNGCKPIPAVY